MVKVCQGECDVCWRRCSIDNKLACHSVEKRKNTNDSDKEMYVLMDK